MPAQIIAVSNQKGGVGKSTLTLQISRAAVLAGLHVLLVDADPQGNLTTSAAREPVAPDAVGLADVLSARAPETIEDVIVPGAWEGADLVPTVGTVLGLVRDELVVTPVGRETRLRDALAPVVDRYDLVLIDCAPALDQLTINALTAAHQALIVTQAKLYASNGLAALLDTIEQTRQHYNPGLSVAGVLVNLYEGSTVAARQWYAELQEAAAAREIPMLEPPVPRWVVIADASEAGMGVDEWGSPEGRRAADLIQSHFRSIHPQGGTQ